MNRTTVAEQTKTSSFLLPAKGILQRKCACGKRTQAGSGECTECKKKSCSLQHRATNQPGQSEVPPIVHDVLGSPGQPLDSVTRIFMEPRFGHNFSGVKIHNDTKASESTHSVNALAYTVGDHIAFRSGQYNPQSNQGRKLLAHELAHTVQQNDSYLSPKTLSIGKENSPLEKNADAIADQVMSANTSPISIVNVSPHIQRTCGSAAIGTVSGCIGVGGQDISDEGSNSDDIYRFEKECDEFRTSEDIRLETFAATISPDATVEVHGFASEEGDAAFNDNLSCARARTAATKISTVTSAAIVLFNHGATSGLREDRRSVVISLFPSVFDLEQGDNPTIREEICANNLGSCEFYHCRDRKNRCGAQGYYRGYGLKYCQRFSQQTSPEMTTAGREWVDCTLLCLQKHIHNNIPENTPCDEVRNSAFDSHAECYVRCGVCSLSPGDHNRLLDTIDFEDIDYSQVFETANKCGFLLFPPAPPSTPGFQGECVMRLGGCSQTRPAGIPTEEEIAQYNSQCRRQTEYTGNDVIPSDEDCERYFSR